MEHCLSHLLGQPEATAEVLVVDFDNLACVPAVASNISEWGCSLTSDSAGELRKNIGIKIENQLRFTRATVTSVKGTVASVLFPKQEEHQEMQEKRRERRNKVSIPAVISDREGVTEISGTIVDAGANGCRISAQGLTSLPEEIMLKMEEFEKPVLGEFAWRKDNVGGIRLIWDMPDVVG